MVAFFNVCGLVALLCALALFWQPNLSAATAGMFICTAVFWIGAALLHELQLQRKMQSITAQLLERSIKSSATPVLQQQVLSVRAKPLS